ncbi:MAG: radical SAM protein [Anaerolineae bacterium]
MGRQFITVISDQTVGVSAGTAAVLGLLRTPLLVAPTTAYLMIGGKCARDCAFCAQARSSAAAETLLSRVNWPSFPTEVVIEALAASLSAWQRVCLQATAASESFSHALLLVRNLKDRVPLPVDVAVLPPSQSAVGELFAAGIDHLGFGVDAATEAVFQRIKGRGWQRYQRLIALAAEQYPGRVAVHLICGLGETEKELAFAVQHYHDMGAVVSLFAFCPVPGTSMSHTHPPALGAYRRVQVARHLIVNDLARATDLVYSDADAIVGLGHANAAQLDGRAFETSGCPGCNRPFYNERPGGPLYNYPRPLTAAEVSQALLETGVPELIVVTERG